MDISQAKEAIRRTVLAYTERTENGQLCIPVEHQRPLLLMGPPGVGKTAVLSQTAQELGIGLVSYTMTHHTRQSALGLPLIREKTYGGRQYAATEYTMSEILAAVYDRMEQTGQRTGILFLDEINCVSETLMPAMLQLLQCKQFGTHRLPEGWIIVAAGNPPQYNQSARCFDTVTMDRVRLLEITENYPVWRDYAQRKGLHPAILAYLELNPDHFYRVEPHAHGRSFVTARGWEHLSELLYAYERLGFSVEEQLFFEFLQHDEIAASFSSFFRLYALCCGQIDLTKLLQGQSSDCMPAFRALRFDGRLAAVEFLLHGLGREVRAYENSKRYLSSLTAFLEAAERMPEPLQAARENLSRREQALAVRKDCGVLLPEEERAERFFASRIHSLLDMAPDLSALRQEEKQSIQSLQASGQKFLLHLRNAIRFTKETFGAGQELLIFLTQLEQLPQIKPFLAQTDHEALLQQLL